MREVFLGLGLVCVGCLFDMAWLDSVKFRSGVFVVVEVLVGVGHRVEDVISIRWGIHGWRGQDIQQVGVAFPEFSNTCIYLGTVGSVGV